MRDGCEHDLEHTDGKHKTILWIMLVINFGMFGIEFVYGFLAHSTALLADSADMLADAFIYGVSLLVVGTTLLKKAKVALVKGILMTTLGLVAFGEALSKVFSDVIPSYGIMTWVGLLALAANITCAVLLLKHKDDDINMKSTWICSRNDIIANLGILLAAGLVTITESAVPDIIIGLSIASLLIKSSSGIIFESIRVLKDS